MLDPQSSSLPQAFLDRMSGLLGSDFAAFYSSFSASRQNGLRVNTLKISPTEFRKRRLFNLEPIPWTGDGYYYDYKEFPGQHPYHAAGVYYLQEPSAMAVVHYLDPQPGEWILDLSAAPGGKSTQIASRLQRQGLLWANEIQPGRARILAANLDRWGAPNCIVSNESPDRLAHHLSQRFDRILLDAPCSGEGMFRKDPAAIKEWSENHVIACARRQSLILDSAAHMLKPGGRLVYSTCTFAPEENEENILNFLASHPDFQPITIPDPAPGFNHSPGLPGAVRLYPHRIKGEGHFIAVLERTQSLAPLPAGNDLIRQPHQANYPKAKDGRRQKEKVPSSTMYQDFFVFAGETLSKSFLQLFHPSGQTPSHSSGQLDFHHHLTLFGSHLYWNPVPGIPLHGLTILRPGLHLGENKPGRFQPGFAFAAALTTDRVRDSLSFAPDDHRLRHYLSRESWEEPGPDGWVLVSVDEFPLGWAKRVNGLLKNHYPKELRQRHA